MLGFRQVCDYQVLRIAMANEPFIPPLGLIATEPDGWKLPLHCLGQRITLRTIIDVVLLSNAQRSRVKSSGPTRHC